MSFLAAERNIERHCLARSGHLFDRQVFPGKKDRIIVGSEPLDRNGTVRFGSDVFVSFRGFAAGDLTVQHYFA